MAPQRDPHYSNIPLFERREISYYMLRKNPQYRQYFKRCPKCSRFSFKPLNANNKVSGMMVTQDRHCALCGYTHKHKGSQE